MADFETESEFHAVVDSGSLRDARQEVEDEFGDLEVSVDAVAQTSGGSGSRRGGGGGGGTGRGSLTATNSTLDDLDDLAMERNDLLRELIDETEQGNRTRGRGGGGGGAGGLLGILGLGLGAGALGLSGLTDALKNFDPELPELPDIPDEIPIIGAPDEIPVDIPGDVPVDVPDDIPVDAPEDIPVDAPDDIPVNSPDDIPVETPFPVPIPVMNAVLEVAEAAAGDPEPAGDSGASGSGETGPVGEIVSAGVGAVTTGVGIARQTGLTGGTPGLPDWYQENAREGIENVQSGQTVSGREQPSAGEAAYRLGGGALMGAGGSYIGGSVGGSLLSRLGIGAGGAAASAGSASAEDGNRSTTRRNETNVTVEVDARDSRNTQDVVRKVERKLPKLERRLRELEDGIR